MHDLIPLNMLAVGQSAILAQTTGLPEHLHRLEELGLRAGATIQMVEHSDGACIIRRDGHKMGLRGDESLRIFVRQGVRP